MFIDSHAHLSSTAFDEDVDGVIDRSKAVGVSAIINICTDKETLQKGIMLRKRYPHIYNVGATTPHDVESLGESDWDAFESAARSGDLVAVGETGLDYHYEHSPVEMQKEYLVHYAQLALSCSLPLVIHCRDAFDDLFALLDDSYGKESVLLHCFTGNAEEAKCAVERGWKISISGIVTFKRSLELREVVKEIPPECLLIETDSPYLAPQSTRGKRCEPAFVKETLACVAQLHSMSIEAMAKITVANTKKFFSI